MTVLPASASVLKGAELASRLPEWSPSAHDRWTLRDTDKSEGIICKREGQTTPERKPQEESRARVFRVFKNLAKHIDFEVALFYREGDDPPQATIRIKDKLVFIAQGGKLYLLMKDLRWTDYGKTEKPSSLFHPASDPPPMQYEDGTAGVGTRMWMRDRVMLTSIHMTFIWGFVPTNEIPSRPRENSLPNRGISIILARLPSIKHARTATENNGPNTLDAPDVFIDFYLVIRATGQAMITYCTDCRFRYAYMLHL